MDAVAILKRLIEIGQALNAKDEILHSTDIHKIRQMVIDTQDFVLRMQKDSLQHSIR
jgi:hypothetical protein